jgi:ketosteroid isomerase-like protein
MTFLFELTWVWVVFAAIVGGIGYSMFVNDKKNRTLLVTIIATVVILIGGVALERSIETDREAIRRTLKEISAAITADDLKTVLSYTTPDAAQLRGVATAGMAQAKLSLVHFRNIEINVNDMTVPTTAELSFIVTFRGSAKGNTFLGGSEFFDQYKFPRVVFEKHDTRWLATDEVDFDIRFPLSYGNTLPVL